MKNTNKLFLVTFRGQSVANGRAYVIAKHPTEAYEKAKNFADANDLGYRTGRELETIELVAVEGDYLKTGTLLLL